MRKNSENFDSIKQSIEMLLVTLNDKLANLARLVSILNSEESSDSLESAIQEKGITDHLINEVERKIQEIDFIARDNKKTSNKIDIQKIKSFKTKLKHIRKDFRKTVKKFEEGEKTTKRRQNYFIEEELKAKVDYNLDLSEIMVENQISMAQDTLNSLNIQHSRIKKTAETLAKMGETLKKVKIVLTSVVRRNCEDRYFVYVGMVLSIFLIFLFWFLL